MSYRTNHTIFINSILTMKKQIFTFFLSLIPFIGRAQEQTASPFHKGDHEGGLFVGGAVTYWNNTKTKATTLQLYPEVGWCFNETWAAGMMLGYAFGSERGEDGRENTHTLKLSPFVRYYYLHKGPFNLYLDGGFGYNYITPVGTDGINKHHGFEIGLRPGICVDLTKGLCLCMRIGFAGYRKNYFAGEEQEIGNDGFGLRFAPEEGDDRVGAGVLI